jgi:RNA polymerase sigma-70 factor, ECF subfamily
LKVAEHEVDDRQLVEAAQRDPSHFAALYERNFDRVYGFVARRVRSREEAEDLTSEIFHQALASLGGFHWTGRPFVAWLLGIAANLMAKRWQRDSPHAEIRAEDLELAARSDGTERQALLSQLVNLLPEDQRLVIVRRFVEQRSIRDVAAEMGRSEGAVKLLQFRALESLREQVRSRHE